MEKVSLEVRQKEIVLIIKRIGALKQDVFSEVVSQLNTLFRE